MAEHPLREPLHGQLMLALYRSGRQADALAAYERFRRTLDDELGIEPTEPLRQLQFKSSTRTASLAPPPSACPPTRGGLRVLDRVRRSRGRARRTRRRVRGRRGGARRDAADRRPGGDRQDAAHPRARRARDARGATVLEGRCIQLVGSGLPYLPVVDALRPLCGAPR